MLYLKHELQKRLVLAHMYNICTYYSVWDFCTSPHVLEVCFLLKNLHVGLTRLNSPPYLHNNNNNEKKKKKKKKKKKVQTSRTQRPGGSRLCVGCDTCGQRTSGSLQGRRQTTRWADDGALERRKATHLGRHCGLPLG